MTRALGPFLHTPELSNLIQIKTRHNFLATLRHLPDSLLVPVQVSYRDPWIQRKPPSLGLCWLAEGHWGSRRGQRSLKFCYIQGKPMLIWRVHGRYQQWWNCCDVCGCATLLLLLPEQEEVEWIVWKAIASLFPCSPIFSELQFSAFHFTKYIRSSDVNHNLRSKASFLSLPRCLQAEKFTLEFYHGVWNKHLRINRQISTTSKGLFNFPLLLLSLK